MAAKKRASSKKRVTLELDVETLRALLEAAEALSELAAAVILASDDPQVRKLAKKGRKRR